MPYSAAGCRALVLLLAAAFLPAPIRGQAPTGLECIETLELPRFAVVNRVPDGGTVKVNVQLGHSGEIVRLHAFGAARSLEKEVEYHIRSKSTFKKACKGGDFHLEFEFRMELADTYSEVTRTYFSPPNRFLIVSQLPRAQRDQLKGSPARPPRQ